MSKFIFFTLSVFVFANAVAQTSDSGQFIIHRHLKVVGKEVYELNRMADGTAVYSINCFYSDRGKDVPLKTTMVLSASGEPLKMTSKGFTSRMSAINDTVTMNRENVVIKRNASDFTRKLSRHMFPVNAYAPATMQWLLVNWWIKNGKPARTYKMLGKIDIRSFGTESVRAENGQIKLYAYGIKDIIWGWEFLWIDDKGRLAALSTINAEGDKIEFIHPDYESQLIYFAQKSVEYGTRQYVAKTKVRKPYAITHGVLVDLENGIEIPDAAIIITNGKISWTGPTRNAVLPPDADIIDAKGRHMLPGLWDMHAHLKQVEWGPAYIAAGITTVRDMANEFVFINALKKSIDSGNGIGPRILRAGIIDGPGPLGNGIMIAETKDAGIALVKKYKAAGFDQVKLYGSLSPSVSEAICAEAHREGMTVTGHIPKSITTVQGIDMGIDMIAHAPYIMQAFEIDSSYMVDLNKPANQIVLKKILDKKVVADPTLALFEFVYRPLDKPIETIEPAFNTLPAVLQDGFRRTGILSPAEVSKKDSVLKGWKNLIFQLHKAGVPVVAGTDMLLPGYTLYRELELYVEAGFTPLEALQSATLTPARVMGFSSRSGSLAIGKDADIILIDGNPLKKISDIRKVSLVVKGGRVYNSNELHRIVGFELPFSK